MWYFFKILSSIASILLIVLTIPIAFDVGGKDAGLAFSLSLATLYFFLSTLSLLTPRTSRVRKSLLYALTKLSWIMVCGLLIWSLAKFAVDAPTTNWVDRAFRFRGAAAKDLSLHERIFGTGGLFEMAALGSWDKLLRWSIPVFQIGEGFCSLLFIQACGQLTEWVVTGEHGDSWMIGLMSVAAGIIFSAMYTLYRISMFPGIDSIDYFLIGFALACAIILASYGFISSKGNVIEISLLFAYVTLCIYQIFTDYQSSSVPRPSEASSQPALPPMPPIIMASYSTFLHFASMFPSYVYNFFSFVSAAFMTITPSVIISLAYRTFVMLAAARIIPAVRDFGARALHHPPSLEVSDEAERVLAILGAYAPTILVAVYTSLMMQHFESLSGGQDAAQVGWWASQGASAGGNLWRWINLAFTMTIYAVELYVGRESRLTHHWHTD